MTIFSPSRALTVLLSVGVASSCAHNPARKLEATNEDVEIQPNGSFVRGNEHLDEEEFYALVGDQKAVTQIQGIRDQGEMFQPLGIGVGVVGAAVAVGGYFYFSSSTKKPIVGEAADFYVGYGLMGLGALGAVGGGYLWFDGNEKASGKNRVFDEKYALNSLETARYGSGGATQSTVASVELAPASKSPTYCSVGATPLAPLVARDEKKRAIKLDATRQAWFKWHVEPAQDLVTPQHDAVVSPLARSLSALGKDVVIDVAVDAPTNVKTRLDLKPDYGCSGRGFGFGGEGGSSGSSGEGGQSASEGGGGGQGGPGGTGSDGGRGAEVDAEITSIAAPTGEQLAVLAVQEHGGPVNLAVFDPNKARVVIDASGGPGGAGGGGGSGGAGWSYGGSDCRQGGPGGAGGSGGSGGRGGQGGTVHLRGDSNLLKAVEIGVNGGSGGSGGFAGGGGSGGGSDSCPGTSISAGPAGPRGAPGSQGPSGAPGRADVSSATKGQMKLIPAALASLKVGGAPPSPEAEAPKADKPKKKR